MLLWCRNALAAALICLTVALSVLAVTGFRERRGFVARCIGAGAWDEIRSAIRDRLFLSFEPSGGSMTWVEGTIRRVGRTRFAVSGTSEIDSGGSSREVWFEAVVDCVDDGYRYAVVELTVR